MRLVQVGADGEAPFVDVIMTINRPDDLDDIANLGLTVADGKRVLAGLQQEIVAARQEPPVQRPECRSCKGVCHLKDYRNHVVATHLGQVTVRLPRFRCTGCDAIETGVAGRRIAGRRRNSTSFKRIFPP